MFLKEIWDKYEGNIVYPRYIKNIEKIDFNLIENKIRNEDYDFFDNFVKNLFHGHFYILENGFEPSFLNQLKKNTLNYFSSKPQSFHKMLEGCPIFHRMIDFETGKKYSFNQCKHSYYLYPWNDHEINVFKEIYRKWRVLKNLMGLDPYIFENNTPKDGVIDRVQLVNYPSKFGYLEPHTDPYLYQKILISVYMSKIGKDFDGVGFYVLKDENNIESVENNIEVGDIGIALATVCHGVAPVEGLHNSSEGRWFLSLYSNESDEVKNRHTSSPFKPQLNLDIKKQIFPQI